MTGSRRDGLWLLLVAAAVVLVVVVIVAACGGLSFAQAANRACAEHGGVQQIPQDSGNTVVCKDGQARDANY